MRGAGNRNRLIHLPNSTRTVTPRTAPHPPYLITLNQSPKTNLTLGIKSDILIMTVFP